MSNFRNYVVVLWILCLVTLGVVSVTANREITEQRKNGDNLEKGSESNSR